MNLEIKEKYDDFIRIIEKKEKNVWLNQTINHPNQLEQMHQSQSNYQSDLMFYNENVILETNKPKFNSDNCDCELSKGFTSANSKSSNISKISNTPKSFKLSKSPANSNNFSHLKLQTQSNIISNHNHNNNSPNKLSYLNNFEDELSLLNDDFVIKKTNKKSYSNTNSNSNSNSNSSLTTSSPHTINTEFKHIFEKDLNLSNMEYDNITINKNDSVLIKKKLDKMFNKILEKKEKNINNIDNKTKSSNSNNYILSTHINLNLLKNNPNEIIKKLSGFCEKYIFEESTRGWNFTSNVYILNFVKLLENFKKIVFDKNNSNPCIKIGFFYRDYLNPKINLENDFTKYWIGYENSNDYDEIKKINYSIKNKLLFYSFKNLSKSTKFKKKIGKTFYKFFKKTIQISNNKDLIIDLIFYVGIKN